MFDLVKILKCARWRVSLIIPNSLISHTPVVLPIDKFCSRSICTHWNKEELSYMRWEETVIRNCGRKRQINNRSEF
ncbi:hypothetical protein V1477_020258 [Vespula maculifrons]|uniref:Uncharacterized protein n=1 Tax=Vespula maculifrons TaxID=7453 RepID=A0ABD2ALF4_VESMC